VKLRMSLFFPALCMVMIFLGAQIGSAQALQPLQPQEPAWLTQMYAEGWQKVQEGVLQRTTGGQNETFTYGEEGLRYQVEKLKVQVNLLQQFYNQNPSPELGKAIDHLQNQIGIANARLSGGQVESPATEQMDNCDISYGAHAYATFLTGAQAPGVSASADAYFHNNCGFQGNTYAYAYVQAASGTVFSTKTQEDPKYGAWIDSAAQWTLSGSTNCSSSSYARAWSDSLNISYETSAQNSYCPVPPPSVFISGTSNVYTDNYNPCQNATWTASVSGGTPGYTIYWYIGGVYQGSGSQFTKQYCYTTTSETVTAMAYDSGSPQQSGQGSYTTNVYHSTYTDPCINKPYSCQCDPSYCCGTRFCVDQDLR
jgi:hypothetical protein